MGIMWYLSHMFEKEDENIVDEAIKQARFEEYISAVDALEERVEKLESIVKALSNQSLPDGAKIVDGEVMVPLNSNIGKSYDPVMELVRKKKHNID